MISATNLSYPNQSSARDGRWCIALNGAGVVVRDQFTSDGTAREAPLTFSDFGYVPANDWSPPILTGRRIVSFVMVGIFIIAVVAWSAAA